MLLITKIPQLLLNPVGWDRIRVSTQYTHIVRGVPAAELGLRQMRQVGDTLPYCLIGKIGARRDFLLVR